MLDMENLPPRLRRADAAEYLLRRHGISVAVATLAGWACRGGGPAFQKDGIWPTYPIAELDRWALARLSPVVRSTSELAAASA